MRFSKGIQMAILLALCFGLPAHGASSCSEAAQNVWLTSCGRALYEVRRAEGPPLPKDHPWDDDVLFKAHAELSDELVEACDKLVAEPDRLPAKAAERLRPLKADPCTRDEHLQWLRSCEDEALALPGHTGADLLATFYPAGGFSPAYVHKRCLSLKVDVYFSPTAEGVEPPNDVIDTVSPPYVDAPSFG